MNCLIETCNVQVGDMERTYAVYEEGKRPDEDEPIGYACETHRLDVRYEIDYDSVFFVLQV